MLAELRVRNFALVEDGALELGAGMTAFTGETGAGKSLLLDAITLLLGVKARSDLVRTGAKSAEVEGVFDLSRDQAKRRLAQELGFEVDPEEGSRLLVRREISAEEVGRNRVWIQGRAATRAQLQSLLGDWVEVSGQHEFLRLAREDFVLGLIDQYGTLKEEVRVFQERYSEQLELARQLEAVESTEFGRQSRLDYLKFQIEELERAGISAGSAEEEERLIALRSRLGSIEKIRAALESSRAQLEGEVSADGLSQQGILGLVQNVTRELRPFAQLDAEFARLLTSADALGSSAVEFQGLLVEMVESVEADPEALENAEAQLSALNRLKRKYSRSLESLNELLVASRREWEDLNAPGDRIAALKARVAAGQGALQKSALRLHESRAKAAARVQSAWQKDLAALGMKQAKIKLDLVRLDKLRPSGGTHVGALFSANPGESLKPLGKVASGGELSRILLALKYIIAGRSEIGVYLFDEVDAGIGGETAHAVGARLRAIAEDNQVLVVTHLAQVAASAHHQVKIEKRFADGRVRTFIEDLVAKERPVEIARMLGDTESKAAQSLARELLRRAVQGAEAS